MAKGTFGLKGLRITGHGRCVNTGAFAFYFLFNWIQWPLDLQIICFADLIYFNKYTIFFFTGHILQSLGTLIQLSLIKRKLTLLQIDLELWYLQVEWYVLCRLATEFLAHTEIESNTWRWQWAHSVTAIVLFICVFVAIGMDIVPYYSFLTV